MQLDRELLAEYRASRSPDAFEQIVERHGAMVLRVALRLLHNRQDAEDASQITFVKLVQRPEAALANPAGWLHKVAKDAARDMLLSRRRRVRRERGGVPPMVAFREADFEGLREEIDAALARLSPVLREAVVLHYLEGRPIEEAARMAGCPESTFRSRTMRGLQRLREVLAARGVACGVATLTAFLGAEALAAASPSPQAMLAMSKAYAVAAGARHAARPALLGKLKVIAAVAAVGGGLTVGAIRHEANRGARREAAGASRPSAPRAPESESASAVGARSPRAAYHFDEPGGAVAADSGAGVPADGRIVGGVSRVAGPSGRALRVDGVSGGVALGNPAKLDFSGRITLAAWIRPEVVAGHHEIVGHYLLRPPRAAIYLRVHKDRYQVGFWGDPSDPDNRGTDYCAESPIPAGDLGSWVHLAGVHDGAAWTLYRDGVAVASTATPHGAVPVPAPWAIGMRRNADGWGDTHFFRGGIDEVRIYDVALTPSEVAALAVRRPPSPPREPAGPAASPPAAGPGGRPD